MKVIQKVKKFIAVLLLAVLITNILPVSELSRSSSGDSETGSISVNADSNDRRKTWIQLSQGKATTEVDEIQGIDVPSLRIIALFLSNYYVPFSTVIDGTSIQFKKEDGETDTEKMTEFQTRMANALINDIGFDKDAANYIVGLTIEYTKKSCQRLFIKKGLLRYLCSDVYNDSDGSHYTLGFYGSGSTDGFSFPTSKDFDEKIDKMVEAGYFMELSATEINATPSSGDKYSDKDKDKYISLSYAELLSLFNVAYNETLVENGLIADFGKPGDTGVVQSTFLTNIEYIYWIDNGTAKPVFSTSDTDVCSYLLATSGLDYDNGIGSALVNVSLEYLQENITNEGVPMFTSVYAPLYVDWVGNIVLYNGTGALVLLPACYNSTSFDYITNEIDAITSHKPINLVNAMGLYEMTKGNIKKQEDIKINKEVQKLVDKDGKPLKGKTYEEMIEIYKKEKKLGDDWKMSNKPPNGPSDVKAYQNYQAFMSWLKEHTIASDKKVEIGYSQFYLASRYTYFGNITPNSLDSATVRQLLSNKDGNELHDSFRNCKITIDGTDVADRKLNQLTLSQFYGLFFHFLNQPYFEVAGVRHLLGYWGEGSSWTERGLCESEEASRQKLEDYINTTFEGMFSVKLDSSNVDGISEIWLKHIDIKSFTPSFENGQTKALLLIDLINTSETAYSNYIYAEDSSKNMGFIYSLCYWVDFNEQSKQLTKMKLLLSNAPMDSIPPRQALENTYDYSQKGYVKPDHRMIGFNDMSILIAATYGTNAFVPNVRALTSAKGSYIKLKDSIRNAKSKSLVNEDSCVWQVRSSLEQGSLNVIKYYYDSGAGMPSDAYNEPIQAEAPSSLTEEVQNSKVFTSPTSVVKAQGDAFGQTIKVSPKAQIGLPWGSTEKANTKIVWDIGGGEELSLVVEQTGASKSTRQTKFCSNKGTKVYSTSKDDKIITNTINSCANTVTIKYNSEEGKSIFRLNNWRMVLGKSDTDLDDKWFGISDKMKAFKDGMVLLEPGNDILSDNHARFADMRTWATEHLKDGWTQTLQPALLNIMFYDNLEEITTETTLFGKEGLFKQANLYDMLESGDTSQITSLQGAQSNYLKGSSTTDAAVESLNSGSNAKFAATIFYAYCFEYYNTDATDYVEETHGINAKLDFSMYPQELGDIDWTFYNDTTGDEIMSFVYYFLHPSKGAGYVRTWFKNKVTGILLGWHEDIVGSTYSNSTTGMTKYLGFTGYVTIPTLNDISWVSKLLANYNSIVVYLIILMCVVMLCYVIIGSLTLQRGILGVIIFAVFAFLPPLAINTVVDFTNQVNDRIYTAKFDYWALVQMQQYVMQLDSAKEAKANGDTSSYANFVISQYTSASTVDSVGGEREVFYSGVKLKWMSPKKYATIATLSKAMDSVDDNGAHYLKNILLNSVASKVSGETYIDSSSALYLYRDYFDIYRYASCAYNADKMAGEGYKPIVNGNQNNIINAWNGGGDTKVSQFKYQNDDITIASLVQENYEKSKGGKTDKYPTSSLFAIRQGFMFNTANIAMTDDNGHRQLVSNYDDATTYFNDNSTKAVGHLLNYTQAYETVADKYEYLREVIDGKHNIDYNSLSDADFFGLDSIKFEKGIQELTGGVKGEELSTFKSEEDYAYFYYALYTESPFYFFSFNVQDQLNSAKQSNTYNWLNYNYTYTDLDVSNEAIKNLFLKENQAYFYNTSKYAGDGYGEMRDYMNFHDFFYYVMPVLRQGTQIAKEFDNVYGLYTYDDCPLHFQQNNGKFFYGGFGSTEYDTWRDFITSTDYTSLNKEAKQHFWHDYNVNTIFNAYSAWYDTMLDCDYAKAETKTIAGKKFTITDPLDPTTYFKLDKSGKLVEGRYMVFSRSEMKFYGLTDADLTQVERKLIKVADEVYKESIDLMNYYTLSDEVLVQAYAMNQLFAFNKEFSQTSLLSEDYVLYPQAYELKAFTYDAYLRLILSGSTGESLMSDSTSEYLTDETQINSNESIYERIMKNTSIFFGLVLLINDFLAVYVLPALKLFFLVLIFLSSVALIIASSIKMEQPVNAFWKCLLAPMLGFAAISIGMAWLVSKFMSEGAQGVVQTSELIVLGDPTMVIVVMTVINVVALILYWKLLKKALGTFINYAKAIGASIGGVVAGVAGGIVGGLTGGGYHFNKRNISKVNPDGDRGSDSSGGGHHNTDPAARGAENDPKNGKAGLGTAAMAGAGTGMVMAQMDGEGSGSGANPARMNGSEGSSSEAKTNAYNEKSSALKSDADRAKNNDVVPDAKKGEATDITLQKAKAKKDSTAELRKTNGEYKALMEKNQLDRANMTSEDKARLNALKSERNMLQGDIGRQNQMRNQKMGAKDGSRINEAVQNGQFTEAQANRIARKKEQSQQRANKAQKSGFASKPQQTQPKLQQSNTTSKSNQTNKPKYNNSAVKKVKSLGNKKVSSPKTSSSFKVPPVTKK